MLKTAHQLLKMFIKLQIGQIANSVPNGPEIVAQDVFKGMRQRPSGRDVSLTVLLNKKRHHVVDIFVENLKLHHVL